MIDWQDVTDSSRVSAVAYEPGTETIYVRFKRDGVEWWYANCPQYMWEEFTRPGVSMGRYIHTDLDGHPNGRLVG